MSEFCKDKVKNQEMKHFYKKTSSLEAASLIQFIPKKSQKSDILNDY